MSICFQKECKHLHDKSCGNCNILEEVRQGLNEAVQSLPNRLQEQKSEISHCLEQDLLHIDNWKAHIVRCANQERYCINK